MSPETLSSYLHRHIPLTAAMRLAAVVSTSERVLLRCPLTPNRNHHDTAFGGSLSAGMMLAGWALLRIRMGAAGLLEGVGLGPEILSGSEPARSHAETDSDAVRLVVSKSSLDFLRPVMTDFHAECRFEDDVLWTRFVDRFASNRWAKLRLQSTVVVDGQVMARLKATYVAVRGGGPADQLREDASPR